MIQKQHLNEARAGQILQQYGYLKRFLAEEKLQEWASKKASTENRWVEIFCYFQKQSIPFEDLSSIIEFALCLPGTSALVERTFSAVTKAWTREKSQLQIKTLKSMLIVKYNMEYSCVDFFNMVSKNSSLLKKISGSAKYHDDDGLSAPLAPADDSSCSASTSAE